MKKKTGYVDDLKVYVRKNLKKGYTKESLKWALVNQGYTKLEVDKVMSIIDAEIAKEQSAMKKSDPTPEIQVDNSFPGEKPFWKKMFGL